MFDPDVDGKRSPPFNHSNSAEKIPKARAIETCQDDIETFQENDPAPKRQKLGQVKQGSLSLVDLPSPGGPLLTHAKWQEMKTEQKAFGFSDISWNHMQRNFSRHSSEPGPRPTSQEKEKEKEEACQVGKNTMNNKLSTCSSTQWNEVIIFDCRYDYEFKGGHIPGARLIETKQSLIDVYNQYKNADNSKRLLIFHCEFSANRGPKAWSCFRDWDRKSNVAVCPKLSFPHTYVMEGGYRSFFKFYSGYCEPRSYRSMMDVAYQSVCRRKSSIFKQEWGKKEVARTRARRVRTSPSPSPQSMMTQQLTFAFADGPTNNSPSNQRANRLLRFPSILDDPPCIIKSLPPECPGSP